MIIKTNTILKQITLFVVGFIATVTTFAQDKKIDVSIDTKSDSSNVFMQPWVWVVGGAVFIIILVALLKGKKD